MTKKPKTVIILRGVSSSGKTTFAETIKNLIGVSEVTAICCADDYFYEDGEYKFDASKLGEAHHYCRDTFAKALSSTFIEVIIVANTNTHWSHAKYYYDLAEEQGHKVFSIVVEKRHDGDNGHCDEQIKNRQRRDLLGSLSL